MLLLLLYYMHMGSKSITVRHVPGDVHRELSTRAAHHGMSLQEYVRRELVRLTARPTTDEVLARVRARKEVTGTELPAQTVVAHRDAERR
jgi:antitoxin FitA